MGTDIHLHIEVKIAGTWEHYAQLRPDRNYIWFGRMAGVQGEDAPIAKARGLPSDATRPTTFNYEHMGSDGHTHSWMNSDEIRILADEFYGRPLRDRGVRGFEGWIGTYLYGNAFAMEDQPEGLEDFRFVFWFDN